jgi:oligoribonuclease NrnB/cAMP/cGMP phosphodiesterase (DHH superfamily)
MKDVNLIKLRPQLGIDTKASTPIETFQNVTLRPILKLQHDTSMLILTESKHFNQILQKVNRSEYDLLTEFIKNYVTKDIRFRYTIIGSVVGMMTQEELQYYTENSSEVNKRIMSMQIKRYADTLRE